MSGIYYQEILRFSNLNENYYVLWIIYGDGSLY